MARHRKTTIVLSVLLFLVAALLAVFILLPSLVKRHYLARLSSLTSLRVSCGDVSSRGLWLRFNDLSVCAEDCSGSDPMVVEVGLLRVLPDFFAFFRGEARPAKIEASNLEVRIDISTPEKSKKLAGAVDSLGRVFSKGPGESGGAGKGGGKSRGSKGGASTMPFAVAASYVDMDVLFPNGIRLRSSDASTSAPAAAGEEHDLSLGNATVSGPGFSIGMDDIRLRLGPAGPRGIPSVDRVSLIGPVIAVWIPGEKLRLEIPSGAPPAKEASKAPPTAEPAAGNTGASPATAGADAAPPAFMADLRRGVESLTGAMAVVGKMEVQIYGGEIVFNEEGSDRPLWEFEKVSGTFAVDPAARSVAAEVFGDMGFLPFSLSLHGGPDRIEAVVDMPQIALKALQPVPAEEDALDISLARADLDGTLTLDMKGNAVRFEGKAGLRDFSVDYYRLASEPVEGLAVGFSGKAEFSFAPFSMNVGASEVWVDGVPFAVTAMSFVRDPSSARAVIKGKLPATDCQTLFSALPFAMRSNLAGFRFGGVLSADVDVDVDFRLPDDSVIEFDVQNKCEVVDEGEIHLQKFNRTFVHEVEDKLGKHSYVMGPGSDNWVDFADISPYMVSAAVTCEDGAFFHHSGVSAFAIKRAVKRDLELKGFFHGASTITMQLSKNLFLSREKTVARKLQEIILSWWLERSMDKDNIMELYLNVVEFGPEIYGVRSASQFYFGKEPKDLTVLESVFLAKMLPNPVARYKYYKGYVATGVLDPAWRGVLEHVTQKMYERGYISKQEYDDAVASAFAFAISGQAEDNPYGP